MRIVVDAKALREERRYTAQQAREIVLRCRTRLREVSLATERRVKEQMPVDTGRARASWGHWTPGDIRKKIEGTGPSDAVWEMKDDGLTIVQGSNVHYIEYLNAGHSRQAPAGFLDVAEEHAMRTLEHYIDEIMREGF